MTEQSTGQGEWEFCTAEGSRLAVLLGGLETTFREKLEWLEKAEELSLRFPINRSRAIAEGRLESDRNEPPSVR